mgnify:FL=1
MNQFLLSIIIPMYNVEQYLADCLDSLIIKEHSDWEIIIVNDGSIDNSMDVARLYANKYSNIRIFIQKNKGLSAARNRGIEEARGKYLYFLDSDDFINNDVLEEMIESAEKYNCDLVSAQAEIVTECSSFHKIDTVKIIECANVPANIVISPKIFLEKQLISNSFQTIVVINLYSSKLIEQNNLRFLNGYLHEDEEWTPRAILLSKKIMYINKTLYYYRKRKNSITTTNLKKEKNFYDLKKIRLFLQKFYNENVNDSDLKLKLLDDLAKRKMYDYYFCKIKNAKEDKEFLYQNSYTLKNKLKSFLLIHFPQVYFKLRGEKK